MTEWEKSEWEKSEKLEKRPFFTHGIITLNPLFNVS